MIENILYKELKRIAGDYLAKKDNIPAIFYKQAPSDTDTWKGFEQYPRIDYYTEYKYNPERKTSGTLFINIWQLQGKELASEDIAHLIKPEIDGLFLTDDISTMSLSWNQTNGWSVGKEAPLIAGSTIIFDIYDYPIARTPVLDPVFSLSQYCKDKVQELMVIGIDKLPEVYRGDLLYFFVESYDVDFDTSIYAVTWIDAVLKGQIVGDNMTNNIVTITHCLALDQEVVLEDTSPCFIEGLKTTKANIGKQISVNARYGVLRGEKEALPLINIGLNMFNKNINLRKQEGLFTKEVNDGN